MRTDAEPGARGTETGPAGRATPEKTESAKAVTAAEAASSAQRSPPELPPLVPEQPETLPKLSLTALPRAWLEPEPADAEAQSSALETALEVLRPSDDEKTSQINERS